MFTMKGDNFKRYSLNAVHSYTSYSNNDRDGFQCVCVCIFFFVVVFLTDQIREVEESHPRTHICMCLYMQ